MMAGVRRNPNAPKEIRDMNSYFGSLVDLIGLSQKILLPPGGQILEDNSLRALDDSTPLHLPYPVTVLEYMLDEGPTRPGALACTKVIVVARERELDDGNVAIVMSIIPCFKHSGSWSPFPEVAIPLTSAVDRSRFINSGELGIRFYGGGTVPGYHQDDYSGEVSALLGVLNALACSNVRCSPLPQLKIRRAIKTAIPFDDYHVLTIETPGKLHAVSGNTHTGRHPREHLRRGHIRCYESGIKTWVSACVVAAGSVGKITKEYAIRRTA
jgi:hypothetical protein